MLVEWTRVLPEYKLSPCLRPPPTLGWPQAGALNGANLRWRACLPGADGQTRVALAQARGVSGPRLSCGRRVHGSRQPSQLARRRVRIWFSAVERRGLVPTDAQ